MPTTVKVEGLRELEAALSDLTKATARNALRRGLTNAAQPVAERARELVPVDTGQLKKSITVSGRVKNNTGKAEYHAVMSAGGSREEARAAFLGARRAAKGEGSFAEIFVGPGPLPHAHLVEFGSIHNTPHPYLRPAWEQEKHGVLASVSSELKASIDKAAARAARKAAKRAAKG